MDAIDNFCLVLAKVVSAGLNSEIRQISELSPVQESGKKRKNPEFPERFYYLRQKNKLSNT